jgi:hypothetical protein
MKKVKLEDVQNLEKISMGLERIPKEKKNQIIIDMEWLATKLREAHRIIEES